MPQAPTRRDYRLTRGQLFRALPKHLMWAAPLGFAGGAVLYFLKDVHLSGMWDLLMFIPLAAVHVNMAVLPVAIPGRHWSFGYIGAMMLFFLLIAGTVLAGKFEFAHARGVHYGVNMIGTNAVTFWAILTGGLLGLLYGLIAGRTGAMVLGMMFGSITGYSIGIIYAQGDWWGVSPIPLDQPVDGFFWLTLNLWQSTVLCGAAMMMMHAASLIGAALGADRK